MQVIPSTLITRLKELDPNWVRLLDWRYEWLEKAHLYQIPPQDDSWNIFMLLAGRGSGKTRTAANEVIWMSAITHEYRFLLAAPTSGDIRDTLFEGESGLMNTVPQFLVKTYNRSLNELILTNGSLIRGIPASEPERFRGANWNAALYDELAAFQYPRQAWDLSQMSVRLGDKTRTLITTTPKPIPLLRELLKREGKDVYVARATSYENMDNLATNFKESLLRYEGTDLGRQEIHAEMIDPSESGLLKKSWFKLYSAEKKLPYFETIVISMDTAMTESTSADRTACTVWGVFKDHDKKTTNALLLDCWADRLAYPDLRERARGAWLCRYGEANGGIGQLPTTFLIEDKGSGISLRQDLASENIPVVAFNPGRADKVQRANLASPILKDGFIWLPESDKRPGEFRNWIDDLMEEITIFPNDKEHDDYVDSCVQAWHWLYSSNYLHAPLKADREEDPYEVDYSKKRKGNPYAM